MLPNFGQITSKLLNFTKGDFFWKCTVVIIFCLFLQSSGCSWPTATQPSIEFTKIPPAGVGGPTKLDTIEGRVTGNHPGQKIVLYAYAGTWWVQPLSKNPMTEIQPDSSWKNQTHLGTEYAALLVEADYLPPSKTDELPEVGSGVIAVASTSGINATDLPPPVIIQFSGYEWKVSGSESERSGGAVFFDPANAWTDERGFLHLRITQNSGKWMCSSINLTRSLGYGTYRIAVRDASQLEPATVLSMSTYDERESREHHREMNIQITRWGDPHNKNLQYVVQPYDVPTNIARYNVPGGVLTHTLHWNAGQAEFKTVSGRSEDPRAQVIAEHQFSTGIPTPGGELIHIDFYPFLYSNSPLQRETEVVIEKFEFLP